MTISPSIAKMPAQPKTKNTDMTKAEAIEKLNAIEKGDTEDAHIQTDRIVLEFLQHNGFSDLAEAWHAVEDRCGGFWYA